MTTYVQSLDSMTPAEQRVALGGRDCHGNNYHVTSLGARESSGATSDAPGLYPADEEGGRSADARVAPGAWVAEYEQRARCEFTPGTDAATVAAVNAYFGGEPLPPAPPADAPTWGDPDPGCADPVVARPAPPVAQSAGSVPPRRRGGFRRP